MHKYDNEMTTYVRYKTQDLVVECKREKLIRLCNLLTCVG